MGNRNEIIEIEGYVQAETGDAYLFVPHAKPGRATGNSRKWLPKRARGMPCAEWQSDSSMMSMPVWLAENEGFV